MSRAIKNERSDFKTCLKALKALGDANRLRTAALLAQAGRKLCVCELVDALRENQYNVSRYAGALCAAGIIRKEKKGRWTMYILDERGPLHDYIVKLVKPVPCCGLIAKDLARLKQRLACREKGVCVIGCKC